MSDSIIGDDSPVSYNVAGRATGKRAERLTQVPRKTTAFNAVRKMGLALREVEEGTIYGSPALKVRGKMFACVAIHRSAEPDTLVARIEFDRRDELVVAEPEIYHLTDH